MDSADTQRQEWMRRFAAALLQLRPATGAEAADEVAAVAVETAMDMIPGDAAEVFVDILNAHVPIHDLRRWVKKTKDSR